MNGNSTGRLRKIAFLADCVEQGIISKAEALYLTKCPNKSSDINVNGASRETKEKGRSDGEWEGGKESSSYEGSLQLILQRQKERQTDRKTDRQTDRQTDARTNAHRHTLRRQEVIT